MVGIALDLKKKKTLYTGLMNSAPAGTSDDKVRKHSGVGFMVSLEKKVLPARDNVHDDTTFLPLSLRHCALK